MGCYVDGSSGRLLKNGVSLSAFGGASNATIGNCVSACQAQGYMYCGEEYYSECYGSNNEPDMGLLAGSQPLKSGCDFPCNGNKTEVSCAFVRWLLLKLVGRRLTDAFDRLAAAAIGSWCT